MHLQKTKETDKKNENNFLKKTDEIENCSEIYNKMILNDEKITRKPNEVDEERAKLTKEIFDNGEKIAKNVVMKKTETNLLAKECKRIKETLKIFPNSKREAIDKKQNINEVISIHANVAVARFSINDEKFKQLQAVSSKFTPKGFVEKANRNEFVSHNVNQINELDKSSGWSRSGDTEIKILEAINKFIVERKFDNYVNGDIFMHTRLQPCMSCMDTIRQFAELYPNIKIFVTYEKDYGDKNNKEDNDIENFQKTLNNLKKEYEKGKLS